VIHVPLSTVLNVSQPELTRPELALYSLIVRKCVTNQDLRMCLQYECVHSLRKSVWLLPFANQQLVHLISCLVTKVNEQI